MVDKSIVAMGAHYVVRYMRHQNSYPAEAYLNEAHVGVKARLLVLAQNFAEHGRLYSDQNGHWLEGDFADLYEFKPHKHRIFAFRDGTNIYLVSGAPKRRGKAQVGDYKAAMTLRADYFARKRRTVTKHP